MKKIWKVLTLSLLIFVSLIGSIGCNSSEEVESEFGLKEFKNKMKEKGYEYKIQNLQEGLLTPISQYMMLYKNVTIDGNEVNLYDTDVVVYSYKDNKEMEKEASTINKEASKIIKDENPIEIEWSETPHFYKKGSVIVQYIGEDKKIISDLKEILGNQFAGIE